jgi:hypothetical protein
MVARSALILLLLIPPLSLYAGESATMMLPMELDQLALQAELIVVGAVGTVERRTHQNFTFDVAILHPEEVLKGAVPPDEAIAIRFYTGLSTSPVFTAGEEVVVFLKRLPEEDTYETVGAWQGKYSFQGGIVQREQVPLEVFLQRIREFLLTGKPSRN